MTHKPQGTPVALVTGSGRGIGRGIALRLAGDGYCVIVNGVRFDASNAESGVYEVKKVIEKRGGQCELFRADVSSSADRRALVEFVAERFGRLDLLVNNAGVAPSERLDAFDATEESFERLISINLKGPYFLTQALAKLMIAWMREGRQPKARIAFVTSISAYTASVNRGDYCLSKAGLSMAVKLWASRLAEFDIPVIEIRPGIIRTDMTAGVVEKYDRLIAEGLLPQRRWGEPADVARAVTAFARGDLDYSTGAAIDVAGGFGIQRL